MASNQEVIEAIDKFKKQYDLDMRGDNKVNGGSRGLVEAVRRINEYHLKYPSLIYLLTHKTVKTIGTILLVIVAVFALVQVITPEIIFSTLAGILY